MQNKYRWYITNDIKKESRAITKPATPGRIYPEPQRKVYYLRALCTSFYAYMYIVQRNRQVT